LFETSVSHTQTDRRLWMLSELRGAGGPAGFQRRLAEGMQRRGHTVAYGPEVGQADCVLVIGGSRHLGALWRARRRGLPIIQRLNGINWIHRVRPTGVRHYLRAEANNLLMRAVRRLADRVVYQSQFARDWWERTYGVADAEATVIHNAVQLDRFSPAGPEMPPPDRVRLLVVEGQLAGGYQVGLQWALSLAAGLRQRLTQPVELVVAGLVEPDARQAAGGDVTWAGLLPTEAIPGLHRGAHLLFSADLSPACPNSVIEALACGNPVVAFETGALPELLTEDSGRLVAYGADPWRVEPPDIQALVAAAVEVIDRNPALRQGARRRAEAAFGLDRMLDRYLAFFGWS